MNENNEKKPDLMAMPEEATPKKDDKKQFRKKLLLVTGIIAGVLILILVVLLIVQLIVGRSLSFEQIEVKMKEAAVEYYKVQKDLLPKEEGGKDTVDASTLSQGEYMKPLSEYTKKGVSCSGEVQVARIHDRYVYTPYLNCGDAYQTKELYKAIIEQGVVTAGYGLYQMGDTYVYRGEKVNNYVLYAGVLWRVVKVTSSHQVMLILEDADYMPSLEWDDRYNQTAGQKTGINTYQISRIKEALEVYYEEETEDTLTFSKSDKDKLATFTLCAGPRAENHAVNDNSQECAVPIKNQIIGLLTASDYMNASTDANCHATLDKSCQNYNYLRNKMNWWLVTPDPKDTRTVYYVTLSGNIATSKPVNAKYLRPVVQLSETVMIQGGEGTEEKPYQLK